MKRLSALAVCLLVCACNHDGSGPRDGGSQVGDPFAAVNALVKSKDYPAAVQKLEAMRAQKGDDPEVSLRLMELYHRQDEPARAIMRGRDAIAAHPDAKELYVPLADLYAQNLQFEPAQALLLEARKRGIDDKEVAFKLGTVLANLHDNTGARAEFERALAAGLEERLGKYNLALLSVAEDDRPKARAMLEDVVAKNPKFSAAKRELAHVILDQAILDAGESRQVDMAQVNVAMNMLWDLKDDLKEDWRVYEAMGDGWLLQGDFDASVAAYTDALRYGKNPKSVEARYRVAMTKKKEADAKKAKDKGQEPAGPKPGGAPK
jgi:tetratricopeptide (TPR) repeat protein